MKRALFLPPILLLSSCVSLLPEAPPPARLFALQAESVTRSPGAAIDAAIAVAQPGGESIVMGTDLVWRIGDELALVANTQWSTPAESALRAVLIETLEGQGRFNAVTRTGEARAAYEVQWDVLNFEVREDDMAAHFTVSVRIVALPSRAILAQRQIAASAPVSDRSASIAAQALARAAREGSARIGEFAAEAAAQAGAARP